MSENIEQFALYSAKIFQLLYDSFPIPLGIDGNAVISEYLAFDGHDELKALRTKEGVADIVNYTDDLVLKARVKEKLPAIQARIAELEERKRSDRHRQMRIYEGTLAFVMSEGIIKKYGSEGYQFTSKGFAHLSKSFKDGAINNEDSTNILAVKSIFKKSADMSIQVASDIAVNVVTRILGYS